MGVSTDAILFYGIDFGDETVSWSELLKSHGIDSDDERWEDQDFQRLLQWKVSQLPVEEFDALPYEKRREFGKDRACEVGIHQSYDYPCYYAYVITSHYRANRGFPQEIPDGLHFEQRWRNLLKEYCELMKLPFSEPKWLLASLWG